MDDVETSAWLSEIAKSQLSSITFVMDYLQLDFDGNRYTMYIWPKVVIGQKSWQIVDAEYRNKLCSLITQLVDDVSYQEQLTITIRFENGSQIILPINSNNPDIIGEIGFYEDVNGKWMAMV